jgi:hypothetical protein
MSETDRLARLAGVLYLLVLPTAGPWFYISAALTGGDAATLANLQAGRSTLVLAIVLGALGHVVQLVAAIVLYRLLSPFGKVAASSMLVLIAVSMPLSFAAMARETDLLALLDGAAGSSVLGGELLQTQIALTATSYTSVVNTAALFWGLWLFPLGWALLRCGFVPRVIGVLVMLGGPFYVMAFFGPLLVADYPSSIVASVVGFGSGIPDLLGELGAALWLTIMGARATRPATPSAARSG